LKKDSPKGRDKITDGKGQLDWESRMLDKGNVQRLQGEREMTREAGVE